jgi:hypothetical protein
MEPYRSVGSALFCDHRWATDNKVLRVTRQLSAEFPHNHDFNSGSPLGIGVYFQSLITTSVKSN